MPFAFPGQQMPDHIGRRKRRLETAWGYAPATGGGLPTPPDGFSLITLEAPYVVDDWGHFYTMEF